MGAGMRRLEFFRPPFSVSGPYLVDSLSNTWINGMLMQMLDPAFILHGSKIQADYASNPKVTPFLQFWTSPWTSDEHHKCRWNSAGFLAKINLWYFQIQNYQC